MASLAWLFDCLGQQVFVIARNPAVAALMPAGTPPDKLKEWGGYATTIFVLGWATGGLIFGAVGDRIKAFSFNSSGKLNSTPQSSTSKAFPYPGATPSISGSSKATSILWAAENSSPAVLHAYNANNLAVELYNSNQAGTRDQFGNGNKFITPTIANGKVYVGTQTGVGVFGLLP